MNKFSHDDVLKTIEPFISNKNVLDIGCVEHSINRRHKERIWVHDFLREKSSTVK